MEAAHLVWVLGEKVVPAPRVVKREPKRQVLVCGIGPLAGGTKLLAHYIVAMRQRDAALEVPSRGISVVVPK